MSNEIGYLKIFIDGIVDLGIDGIFANGVEIVRAVASSV